MLSPACPSSLHGQIRGYSPEECAPSRTPGDFSMSYVRPGRLQAWRQKQMNRLFPLESLAPFLPTFHPFSLSLFPSSIFPSAIFSCPFPSYFSIIFCPYAPPSRCSFSFLFKVSQPQGACCSSKRPAEKLCKCIGLSRCSVGIS